MEYVNLKVKIDVLNIEIERALEQLNSSTTAELRAYWLGYVKALRGILAGVQMEYERTTLNGQGTHPPKMHSSRLFLARKR